MKCTIGKTSNGLKTVKVTFDNDDKGFSIQTNGNLPETHRNGVCETTIKEVIGYVFNNGTESQYKKVINDVKNHINTLKTNYDKLSKHP
jgi:hypothetical protein